jgi:hypothetical protein
MNDGTPQADPKPTFYLYKGDDGRWYKTSQLVTEEINKHIYFGKDFDTQKRAFYPQWDEPDLKSTIKPAWYMHADGLLRMRLTITVRDHLRTHSRCTPLGDGSCLQQSPLKLGWEPKHKLWTIIEPPNQATREQMRKFKDPYKS